ncbi:MAG: TonB-dependent receptor [Bacteroidota bacterium]|nr:TonB-dependent receptor [Bacteroidota bacterium]
MNHLTHLLCFFVAVGLTWAQHAAILRGTIIDRTTGRPVGYAAVGLLRSNDTSTRPIRGTLSLKDGTFLLRNIPPGTYRLSIRMLGYAYTTVDSVHLNPGEQLDLGQIYLNQESIVSQSVEVNAERELMEFRPDRRIYQVGKDLTAVGGMATDVLQNVPGITVDQDRTIQLRGSSNVTILVDGKPTALTGGDRSGGTGLDNIPADAIEAIEVITTPGAQFDADGGAGIVNIILKREHQQPLTAFGSVTVGTRDKYTGFASLGMRSDAMRIDGSYSLSLQNYDFDRSILLVPSAPIILYPGSITGIRPVRTLTHAPRLNVDITAMGGTLSATLGALIQHQRTTNSTTYTYYQQENGVSSRTPTGQVEVRSGMQEDTTTGLDLALGYRRALLPEWSLSSEIRFSTTSARTGYLGMMSMPRDGITAANTSEWNSEIQLTSAQIDTRYRFSSQLQLEAGLKASLRHLESNQIARADSTDPLATDLTIRTGAATNERIYAAYTQATVSAGVLQVVAGLRAEATQFDVSFHSSADYLRQRYWNLFPTLSISYAFDPLYRIGLRYSRRISRPSNEALNPVIQLDDPYNQRQGMPNLQPELVHAIELTSTFILPWATVAPTLYWRSSTQPIGRYRTFDPRLGITRLTFVNWDRLDASGIELVLQAPLLPGWRMIWSGSIAYQSIVAGSIQPGLSNNGWTATINWQNVFNFGGGWSGQLAYNLRHIGPVAQGTIGTIRAGELALRYEFLDRRAAIAVRLSDPLDERVFTVAMRTNTFDQDLRFKRESRIAFVTFSYLFGSGTLPGNSTDVRPPADEM